MRSHIQSDNGTWELQTEQNGASTGYVITGAMEATGSASVVETQPGQYSVLLADGSSIAVHVTRTEQGLGVLAGKSQFVFSFADLRDASAVNNNAGQKGPAEVRSQMPGKIIKILVQPGAEISTGDALLVIEAMKMQNEMKATKDGRVARVAAVEGTTVSANDLLMVID